MLLNRIVCILSWPVLSVLLVVSQLARISMVAVCSIAVGTEFFTLATILSIAAADILMIRKVITTTIIANIVVVNYCKASIGNIFVKFVAATTAAAAIDKAIAS